VTGFIISNLAVGNIWIHSNSFLIDSLLQQSIGELFSIIKITDKDYKTILEEGE
jgi:hypothetical protein